MESRTLLWNSSELELFETKSRRTRKLLALLVFILCFLATVTQSGCSGITSLADPPPSIKTQPTNQMVTVGQSATFAVVATGTHPLLYQWQKNGAAISGATGASYTTPLTTATDDGTQFTVN